VELNVKAVFSKGANIVGTNAHTMFGEGNEVRARRFESQSFFWMRAFDLIKGTPRLRFLFPAAKH